MSKWLTIKEACHVLNMSERTLRRHVQEGKIESKLDGKRRYVLIDNDTTDHVNGHDPDMPVDMSDKDSLIEVLKQQIQEKDKQIGKLQEQLSGTQKESAEAKGRADTLLLNLQRQLEQSQRMLESSQAKQRRSWWRRIFRKSSDDTD